MELLKMKSDTIIVMATLISGMLGITMWLNSQFNNVHKDISELRTDMAIIKTVMIINKIMPIELAQAEQINSAS